MEGRSDTSRVARRIAAPATGLDDQEERSVAVLLLVDEQHLLRSRSSCAVVTRALS
jgi:hypothetical protein